VAISVKRHATAGLFASLQGFSDSAASGGKAVVPCAPANERGGGGGSSGSGCNPDNHGGGREGGSSKGYSGSAG